MYILGLIVLYICWILILIYDKRQGNYSCGGSCVGKRNTFFRTGAQAPLFRRGGEWDVTVDASSSDARLSRWICRWCWCLCRGWHSQSANSLDR